jgi:carbon monoxide dehydrogenase subunit G
MTFHFSGTPEVAAPLPRVWLRLLDPQVVGNAGPGVQRIRVIDPHHFDVVTGFKVAAFKLQITMKVELSDVVSQQRLRMEARWKTMGSYIQVSYRIRMKDENETRTLLEWEATTQMKVNVASAGRDRQDGLARDLTHRIWDRIIPTDEEDRFES